MKDKTRNLIFIAMFAALVCVATVMIRIPALNGYVNMGDGLVLVCGWSMSGGIAAAGLGSVMADILSGYMFYAPATFIIKCVMAAIAYFGYRKIKLKPFWSKLISAISAEIIMILGYYIFEGFIYGFIESLANIISNCIQGGIGVIVGIILMTILEKSKINNIFWR